MPTDFLRHFLKILWKFLAIDIYLIFQTAETILFENIYLPNTCTKVFLKASLYTFRSYILNSANQICHDAYNPQKETSETL